MKEAEFFRWWVPSPWGGPKLHLTRYRMTVQEAQQRFPGCKADPTSREVRMLPETPEEATIPGDAPYARGRGPRG